MKTYLRSRSKQICSCKTKCAWSNESLIYIHGNVQALKAIRKGEGKITLVLGYIKKVKVIEFVIIIIAFVFYKPVTAQESDCRSIL